MQIGKWLYRIKNYIYCIFRSMWMDWDTISHVSDANWENVKKYRIHGTILKGMIRIDVRVHNREFWFSFLNKFMFVNDVLFMQLTKKEQLNNKETVYKWTLLT